MLNPYAANPSASRGEPVTNPWTRYLRPRISSLMTENQTIDARDLLCPLPVLRLRKALEHASSGQVLHLLATDPAALIDVPHFCAEQGHAFLEAQSQKDGATLYRVRKKA